jgi:hypothetical protein
LIRGEVGRWEKVEGVGCWGVRMLWVSTLMSS